MEYYIPISRRLFEHQLWGEERKFSRFEAWLDIIQSARFEDTKQLIGNRFIVVKRGQMLVSLRFLASRWQWSTKKVNTFLELLIQDKMIIKETPKETGQTVITVCNYDKYNFVSQELETQKKQEGNRKETLRKQEGNKVNIDNKEKELEESKKESPNGDKKEATASSCASSNPDFIKFNDWLKRKAPFCSNPKNFPSQITEAEFLKLKEKYTGKQIADTIEQIENRKDLRKRYTNLYRTVLNWAKNEYGK